MVDKLEEFCLNLLRKIKLGKIADIYIEHQEGMRYLIFGALSTLVNILVFAICSHVIFVKLNSATNLNVSNILALVSAVLFAYVTNKYYVFKSKCEDVKKLIQEMVSFLGCRAITSIMDLVLMNILVEGLKFNDILMKIVVNILVIILNFVFSKLIIFKNEKNGQK